MTPKLRFPEFTDEWQVKKLGDVLSIGSGRDYKHLKDGNIPVYGTGGLMTHVNDYLYDGKSVAIGRKGTIDQPQFLKGKFWTVDTLFYTHGYKSSVPEFIFSLFQNINWKKWNEASGVPSLSSSTIKSIKVNIPSKPEQEKIADFLTAVDERIAVGEKKLELLETYKRGVMQKIFSQQVRFKDDNGNPYPDWEEKKLGEVASFVSGYTFLSSTYSESGVYKIITIANVQDGRMNVDKASKINTLPSNIQKNQVLERGDVLVSMTGNVGRVCKVNIENCLLNQRVGKIVPKNINADFLFAVLNSRRFLAEMESLAQGGAQGNLSSKDIMRYMIKLPSRDEQQKIADFLTTLDDKITAEKSKLTASRQFKKALLQRMFV